MAAERVFNISEVVTLITDYCCDNDNAAFSSPSWQALDALRHINRVCYGVYWHSRFKRVRIAHNDVEGPLRMLHMLQDLARNGTPRSQFIRSMDLRGSRGNLKTQGILVSIAERLEVLYCSNPQIFQPVSRLSDLLTLRELYVSGFAWSNQMMLALPANLQRLDFRATQVAFPAMSPVKHLQYLAIHQCTFSQPSTFPSTQYDASWFKDLQTLKIDMKDDGNAVDPLKLLAAHAHDLRELHYNARHYYGDDRTCLAFFHKLETLKITLSRHCEKIAFPKSLSKLEVQTTSYEAVICGLLYSLQDSDFLPNLTQFPNIYCTTGDHIQSLETHDWRTGYAEQRFTALCCEARSSLEHRGLRLPSYLPPGSIWSRRVVHLEEVSNFYKDTVSRAPVLTTADSMAAWASQPPSLPVGGNNGWENGWGGDAGWGANTDTYWDNGHQDWET